MSGRMGRIWIGTSGYAYKDWREPLYQGVADSERLARYAQVFDCVELNNTFYHLPGARVAAHWRESVPAGFVFAAKGSRYLTHMKRLTDAGPGVERYYARLAGLDEKLAVVLWQLPPGLKPDLARLDAFLRAQPSYFRL